MNKRETLCDYFDEDVVVRHSKNGRLLFGLVIESSENATDDEDDEEDSHSDDGTEEESHSNIKWKKIKPGFAKIANYPNGNTLVINESKAKLYDRSLLSGDVVQRIDKKSNKLAQNSEHGFCKATKIYSTLKVLGTDRVIENVDSSQVEMLSNISVDTVCLLDSWVGYVKEVNQTITLKCGDGSLLKVSDIALDQFTDLLTQRDNDDEKEFNRDDFYVGQQLYGPKKHLKNADWITKTKQMKHSMNCNSIRNSKINVVVEDVDIESVSVNWLCCLSDQQLVKNKASNCDAMIGSNLKNCIKNLSVKSRENSMNVMSHPNDFVTGEAIKRIKCLNYFGKCSLQIGHQCYYTIKSTDNVLAFSKWEEKESKRLMDLELELEIEKSRETSSLCPQNMGLNTSDAKGVTNDYINIENNSIRMSGSDSDSLSSLSSFGSNAYRTKKKCKKIKYRLSLPLKEIKKKKLQASQRKSTYLLPINTSVGSRLPVEIVATNTRVTVVWQSGTVEEDIPSIFLYPVHHIDDHDFFPGDFVVENKDNSEMFDYGVVQRSDFSSRMATVKWFRVALDSHTAQFIAQEDVSVYDIKDHMDFHFRSGCCVVRMAVDESHNYDVLSRAGQVIDLTLDGKLKCIWANGQTSFVYPQELFVIGDYDSDDLWDDSDSDYENYSHLVNGESNYESNSESWETDSQQTDSADHSTKRSAKKSKSHSKGKHSNQLLLDFVYNGATQLDEWLRNGTGNFLNSLQNVIKVYKNNETAGTKVKDGNDSQKESLNSNSQINQLSKRLLQLLPFAQTFRQLLPDSDSVEPNDSTPSQTNQQSSSRDSASDETTVTTFHKLINSLKSEILKVESSSINGETHDPKLINDSKSCALFDGTDTKVTEECEMCTTDTPQDMSAEEAKVNGVSNESSGRLIFLDTAPDCHKYSASINEPKVAKDFLKRVKQEISLLQTALPEGIDVALFHDRIDLFSVIVFGPKGTPYEDGLFLFDIQLPSNYPNVPPLVHYISYCSDRLNPNLYESGKVCISLLGTWSGKGTEVWSATTSNLLQVIISIQGLILVAEPYYNEAGYLKQRGTTIANENSRLYNEMVVIKLIQSMTKLVLTPPTTFETLIREHIIRIGDQFIERHQHWASISETCFANSITTNEDLNKYKESRSDLFLPQFPLLPASHGFCLSLKKAIAIFEQTLLSLK